MSANLICTLRKVFDQGLDELFLADVSSVDEVVADAGHKLFPRAGWSAKHPISRDLKFVRVDAEDSHGRDYPMKVAA